VTEQKNSNLKKIIITIFLIVFVFVMYFLMIHKAPVSNIISTSTATSTITWSTYKNEDLGFQIDYQNELVITLNKNGVSFCENNGDKTIGMWAIGVNVSTTTQNITDILKSHNLIDVFEKKFTIDGFDAYEYGILMEKNGPVYTHTVLIMNGKKLFEINIQDGQYNDQIINSFHFLK
jgi:hypothetical protein